MERIRCTRFRLLLEISSVHPWYLVLVVPVRVQDLAEGQFTAHSQVGLVLSQVRGRAAGGVNLTVLIRLVQSFDELT